MPPWPLRIPPRLALLRSKAPDTLTISGPPRSARRAHSLFKAWWRRQRRWSEPGETKFAEVWLLRPTRAPHPSLSEGMGEEGAPQAFLTAARVNWSQLKRLVRREPDRIPSIALGAGDENASPGLATKNAPLCGLSQQRRARQGGGPARGLEGGGGGATQRTRAQAMFGKCSFVKKGGGATPNAEKTRGTA